MKEIEIPFGAKDSELIESTYHIPDGMEAIIEGDKVIICKKESEDEKTRKEIHKYLYNELHNIDQLTPRTNTFEMWLAWLEKQGNDSYLQEKIERRIAMFNKKRLNEIAKCPSVYDLASSYGRSYQGTIDIEIYQAGAMEVVKRIEDKLNLYCDRPNEFYGAIERMVKELKGE